MGRRAGSDIFKNVYYVVHEGFPVKEPFFVVCVLWAVQSFVKYVAFFFLAVVFLTKTNDY